MLNTIKHVAKMSGTPGPQVTNGRAAASSMDAKFTLVPKRVRAEFPVAPVNVLAAQPALIIALTFAIVPAPIRIERYSHHEQVDSL